MRWQQRAAHGAIDEAGKRLRTIALNVTAVESAEGFSRGSRVKGAQGVPDGTESLTFNDILSCLRDVRPSFRKTFLR
jgi:hypothetical protein